MAKPTNKTAPSKPATKPTGKAPKASADAESKTKAAAAAVAHPKVVAAIRANDTANSAATTSLAALLDVVAETEITRPELVASYMEARNVTKATADSQASRIMALLRSPETADKLRSGEITLKTAREATKKTQANPSPEKAAENAQKKLTSSLTGLINAAKETGMDRDTLVNLVKQAAKKEGIA